MMYSSVFRNFDLFNDAETVIPFVNGSEMLKLNFLNTGFLNTDVLYTKPVEDTNMTDWISSL